MKLYYAIGNLLRPVAAIGFYAYSFLLRTPRARIVLTNDRDEILLLQTWLGGNDWGLPGGGAKRGETAEVSAARELHEETGIILDSAAFRFQYALKYIGHEEKVFLAMVVSEGALPEELPDKFEVKAAQWFPRKNLPRLEPLAQEIIDRVENQA